MLHKIYFFAAIVLIIFAVLVSVMRLLTPIAKRYQPDIEIWATHALGRQVVIGDMATGWHNLSPVIELKEVNIAQFHINSVRVSLSILRSLWHRQLILNQLIFDGMHLDLVQNAQNQWQVQGFTAKLIGDKKLTSSEADPALTWLFSQRELAVQNLSANIKPNQYPSHVIHNLKLMLTNRGHKHYLLGQIIFNDLQHSSIVVAADINGDANDLPNMTAKLYFSGNKIRLTNWLGSDDYYGFQVTQGTLSFQMWGDWQQQRLNSLQSTFSLQNLQLAALADPTLVNVQHFSGSTLWKIDQEQTNSNPTGWQFTADNLQLTINQHPWPLKKIGIFIDQTPSRETQFAQIDFLQLDDLTPLITHFGLIPSDIRQKLNNYNPQGQLKNVRFLHQGKLNVADHFQVLAALQNVGINPVGAIPGIKNLTADINFTANKGSVQLNSTNTTFDFGKLFRQPLTLQKLDGIIQWQADAGGIEVNGLQLNLQHPNMSLQNNFSLLVPNKGEPTLRLLGQFKETDITKITQFLPVSLLAPSVVQWLDQAFVGGKGLQGSVILNGPLNKFPYLHGEGQFIVHSMLDNVKLNFAPGWPTINNLDGELTFKKRGMFFKLAQADLYQLPIKRLTADIADMGQDPQAYLYVEGDIDLPNTAQAEDFVFNSPLRDTVGKSLAGINLQGKGDLHLKLKVPLTSGDVSTDGKLNLQANNLSIPSLKLNFTQLTGLIDFTDSSLSSPLLMANFFQQPLTVSIKTMYQQGERITAFDINSTLSMDTLQQYFSLPKLDFLNGSTAFKARLTLNSNDDAVLKINTNLKGTSIALPKPFDKKLDSEKPFSVDMKIKSGDAPAIKMSYGKLWDLFLIYQKINNNNTLGKVLIHFGPQADTLPTQNGIYINGALKHFYWDEWQPILQKYVFASTASTSEQPALQLEDINIFVDRLTGFKQVVEQAQLDVQHGANAWQAKLISPQIDGQLSIPYDKIQPLVGQFKTLYLRAITEGGGSDMRKFDPSQMIPINLHADSFHYGMQDFGNVTLQVRPIAQGMQIQKLTITKPDLSLDTQGSWTRQNNQDKSNFTGLLTTNNLGALLKQQDITDHIQGGNGTANFTLAWGASPADVAPKILAGNVTLDFKDGAIVGLSQATNEKIGLGKVLNALSLQSIYDRLTFQNKNLDTDGFSFNEMKGMLTFANGDISTNDAYINGQVAQIYINGRVGLTKENFNLLIKVIPYLTSSLPVIATIVGTPILGAITWAADKVVSVGIEKVVVYQYRITGPWADPDVATVGK